jgi:hypothetical protein
MPWQYDVHGKPEWIRGTNAVDYDGVNKRMILQVPRPMLTGIMAAAEALDLPARVDEHGDVTLAMLHDRLLVRR